MNSIFHRNKIPNLKTENLAAIRALVTVNNHCDREFEGPEVVVERRCVARFDHTDFEMPISTVFSKNKETKKIPKNSEHTCELELTVRNSNLP